MSISSYLNNGWYLHFRGGLYKIIGTALHSETGEPLVVYTNQDQTIMFARPFKMFHEAVEHNGKMVSRFTRIDDDDKVD